MWQERRSGKYSQRSQYDHRDPFERDRTRVIHCPAFRRLQRKTQILGTDEGDFHRTRLTHSLEVASISRSIVRNMRIKLNDQPNIRNALPSDDLITCVSLLHDIGHPPFGHGGEVALNYMMHKHGGFESNGQNLRLLTKVEDSYGEFGLDLTRRCLLGVLKYPVEYANLQALSQPNIDNSRTSIRINDWLPPKGYYEDERDVVSWILEPLTDGDRERFQSVKISDSPHKHHQSIYKSLDCSIMDLADDIAYGVHDLEDAIHLKLISRDQILTDEFERLYTQAFSDDKRTVNDWKFFSNALFSSDNTLKKQMIGELVNSFIISAMICEVGTAFEEQLLKYNVVLPEPAQKFLNYLQQIIYKYVIDSHEARTIEYGGQTVILRLFEAVSSNPESLLNDKNRLKLSQCNNEFSRMRIICDYIASMTDEYAYRMHERLFGFNTRTVFERL